MSFTTVSAKGVETVGLAAIGPDPHDDHNHSRRRRWRPGPERARSLRQRPGLRGLRHGLPGRGPGDGDVQYDTGGDWMMAASATASASGRYSIPVSGPGIYRVIYHGTVGPKIAVG